MIVLVVVVAVLVAVVVGKRRGAVAERGSPVLPPSVGPGRDRRYGPGRVPPHHGGL